MSDTSDRVDGIVMRRKGDHVVCHDATKGRDAYMVECLHCGATQRFALPISISVYVAAARAFGKDHKHCEPLE